MDLSFCNAHLFSLQAGLDKMAKGHMLADVVAIIGKKYFYGYTNELLHLVLNLLSHQTPSVATDHWPKVSDFRFG